MVKLTIKLAIVALIANALYQTVPYYYTNWQFQDALKELATYPGHPSTTTLPAVQLKAERIAKAHGLPLTRDDFDIKLATPGSSKTTTIDVSYEVVMKPIPGRPMPHLFALHVEGDPPRFGSLGP
jgi:hypothetical protein